MSTPVESSIFNSYPIYSDAETSHHINMFLFHISLIYSSEEFPKFTSSLSPDDYPIAKMCSGISCYTMKEVEAHVKKQALLRRSVHVYV